MSLFIRKLIRPEDLNANDTLFGGQLLRWIDEESGLFAMIKLNSRRVVTKFMSEINFVSSARQADIIAIRLAITASGKSSITFSCEVRNIFTKTLIITIEKIVFVNVDENGKPSPHGKSLEELQKEE